MDEPSYFAPKIDRWLALVLLSAAAISSAALTSLPQRGQPVGVVALLVMGACGIVLPIWVLLRTGYRLTEHTLCVTSGPFRWRIPLEQIESVRPSRSVWSGPALSLDRLAIRYGRGRCLLVSPKERERFARELMQAVALSRASTR